MRVLPHAVAQGIGWGLLERRSYDDTGRLVSGTLMDEPPVVAAGAAIANVVARDRVRLTALPVTTEAIARAVQTPFGAPRKEAA